MCLSFINKIQIKIVTLSIILLISMPLAAVEKINMEGMSVIGNKESPNLLYIVPWKSPDMPGMAEPVILSRIFNEALTPVVRGDLIREELYRKARHMIRRK